MTNLLKETIEAIEGSGHATEDIIFIGSVKSAYSCTFDEFKLLANIEYDAGFGSQKVASDLIIAFSDGMQMKRGEYDGSEWWEFNKPFRMPESKKPIARLIGGMWDSVGDMNGGES